MSEIYHRKGCAALHPIVKRFFLNDIKDKAQGLCTAYNHAPVYSATVPSHIRRLHTRVAIIGHPHFGQNGRDVLRLTAVTRGGTVIPK